MKKSMSKMSLVRRCGWGFTQDTPAQVVGPEARIGTYTHKLIEVGFFGTKWVDIDIDPTELATAKTLYESAMTWIRPRKERILHCEIGVRYDAQNDKATMGPRRGEEGYEDVPLMILPGTLDLVLRGADNVLEVVDVKTGKKEYETPYQLYAQAVSMSRLLGESVVRVGYLYPRKTKCDEPVWETLDADRLDEEAGTISKLLRRLPMAKQERGDWCFRCDARGMCPQWQPQVA